MYVCMYVCLPVRLYNYPSVRPSLSVFRMEQTPAFLSLLHPFT
jgi:hypothetical protein